jgi:hypothetical protein
MTTMTLPELAEAEIALEGHRTQSDEHKLVSELSRIAGVREPILYGGLLVLQCEANGETKDKIRGVLEDFDLAISWMKLRPVRTEGEMDFAD